MNAGLRRQRLGVVLWVGVQVLVPTIGVRSARANHTTFSFRVDRFEIDGNVNGSGDADATPDLIDEFNDGNLAPNWQLLWGTAVESGGFVSLTNPGLHYTDAVWPTAVFDQSAVFNSFAVADGQGSLVATSTWPNDPLPLNNYNCFVFLALGSSFPQEVIFTCVSNFDAPVAAALGYPAGLALSQGYIREPMMGPRTLISLEATSFQPEDLTGQIVYRIAFDDASNSVTTSVSLDGGGTFQGFTPASLADTGFSIVFQLNVDPVSLEPTATPTVTPTPTPGSTLCQTVPRSGCRTLGKSILLIKHDDAAEAADKLIWKKVKAPATSQSEFGDPLNSADYALCLYVGTPGTLLSEASAPADGAKWSAIGTKGYKYKDPSGVSAGVQKVILKGSTENKTKVLLKGKGAGLPNPPPDALDLPVTAQLVNSDTSVCFEGVYTDAEVVRNEPGQFKAKQQ